MHKTQQEKRLIWSKTILEDQRVEQVNCCNYLGCDVSFGNDNGKDKAIPVTSRGCP
jgi:hypothetical protein